eukprot:164529_1
MQTMNNRAIFQFLPYTKSLHGWKYSKNNYYQHVLRSYFKQNPYIDAPTAFKDVNATIKQHIDDVIKTTALPWGYKSFKNVCGKIKKELQTNQTPIKALRFKTQDTTHKYGYQNLAVDQLFLLFDGLCNSDILLLLNRYSEAVRHYIKYGDAINAMYNSQYMVNWFSVQFRCKTAQIAKQTILSSFVSSSDKDFNNSLLYGLTEGKINNELVNKLVLFRKAVESGTSLKLYDAKFDKKYKEFDKANPKIKQNMYQYWIDYTAMSPHTNDTLITDHTTGEKPGLKPTHTRHTLQGTCTEFFVEWKYDIGKRLCAELGEPVPKYSLFYKMRPVFVKCDKGPSYNLCKKHYNFTAMFKAYKRRMMKIHTHKCTDKCAANCSILCTCNAYTQLRNSGILALKCDRFILQILCENVGYQYPNLKCVNGECDKQCCTSWLDESKCNIDPSTTVEYDQISCNKNKHSKDRHLIMPESKNWVGFISALKVRFSEFAIHAATKKMQNGKRDKLTKK